MIVIWKAQPTDVARVRALKERMIGDVFTQRRIERNVKGRDQLSYSQDEVWRAIVRCLLTTQQRSGPQSKATKIATADPFPFSLDFCRAADDVVEGALNIFDRFGGMWRSNKIAEYMATNLEILEGGGWGTIHASWRELIASGDIETERESASELGHLLKGFGPKQTRNLIQMLGIARYEIPLDSRVIRWINSEIEFPVELSSKGLSDEGYYRFAMTGIQELCGSASIFPCVFDAMVFSSYDDGGWSHDSLVW